MVVPCYNEATRLAGAHLSHLADAVGCHVIAVDDGSTDATAGLLADASALDSRLYVLSMETNRGKGEAVRKGLLWAVDAGYDVIGFCDADFATPAHEVARLVDGCQAGCVVILGSRVGLLGHRIERSSLRHYRGRVFGTLSSIVLGFRVYDTQCGAKAFRASPAFRAAIDQPFSSRWAFDVELLGRLAHQHGGTTDFLEMPLREWHDVMGSKLSFAASFWASLDLLRIWRALARHRRLDRADPALPSVHGDPCSTRR